MLNWSLLAGLFLSVAMYCVGTSSVDVRELDSAAAHEVTGSAAKGRCHSKRRNARCAMESNDACNWAFEQECHDCGPLAHDPLVSRCVYMVNVRCLGHHGDVMVDCGPKLMGTCAGSTCVMTGVRKGNCDPVKDNC